MTHTVRSVIDDRFGQMMGLSFALHVVAAVSLVAAGNMLPKNPPPMQLLSIASRCSAHLLLVSSTMFL